MASEGLEPPTLDFEDRCSNPLSYEARVTLRLEMPVTGTATKRIM